MLDEAQAIKNPTTATTKAARKLKGTRRLVVTGTPVENHLGELWSLMSFANPGLLGTQASFKNRYADYVGTAAGADALAALREADRAVRPAAGTRPTRASPTSCPSASSCATTAR